MESKGSAKAATPLEHLPPVKLDWFKQSSFQQRLVWFRVGQGFDYSRAKTELKIADGLRVGYTRV
jgi:hypothetical protein